MKMAYQAIVSNLAGPTVVSGGLGTLVKDIMSSPGPQIPAEEGCMK